MKFYMFFILIFSVLNSFSQDTTIVQTLTFDSTGRSYMFQFPQDTGQNYEKILMLYTLRCKDGLVSTGSNTNLGCGEWDYSCNTFITDSSYTDSIKSKAPSHIISGFTGTTYNYTTLPTFTYYLYNQQNVTVNSVISENGFNIGIGTQNLTSPFGTSNRTSKSQYLWKATELITAGLTQGDITSIKLNINSAAEQMKYLKIKMKHTSQDTLSSKTPELTGFTEVYFLNTTLVNGINEFHFYNNFSWDGLSNILMEISYTNSVTGSNNMVIGSDLGFNVGLINSGNDNYLDFSGASFVSLGSSNFSGINNAITISLWCNGDSDIMPANSTIFEGSDNNNRRQVNVHLPWSDSNVYWDCGNDGQYDRVYQTANALDYKGKWNHWTFTKDIISGSMKAYLNGNLWLTGTGKTKPIILQNLNFGSAITWNNPYYGSIDDFRIWDRELTQNEIIDLMRSDISPLHPTYSDLVANYSLNEGLGSLVNDQSSAGEEGIINGVASWKQNRGDQLYKNFSETTLRPNITFVQGVYDLTIDTIVVLDSIQNNPNMVTSYQVTGTDLFPVDTNFYYQSGYSYIYDAVTDTVVDSVYFATQNTINISTLIYYAKYPSKFELMSFVTPYGINLNLGMAGKTWQFDVTDYKPVLKGSKLLSVENGGQNQEDMDIKFMFISGIPPRNVMNIQQIWRPGIGWSYTDIMNNDVTEPRFITLNPAASMFKIKSSITGHGQEGEFIARTHYININGGANELQWSVWKECADNPIYPQGGTWIYDRAGWCPGAPTDMKELDFSSIVNPGQTVEIDYGVNSGSGDSRYLVNNQLVTYGPANFALDAGIVEIKSPSTRIEYVRNNPICYNPKVVIRNTGSTTLTSLDITYSVSGGTSQIYHWTGNLQFTKTVDVTLPVPGGSFWVGDGSNNFIVTISNPNNGVDQYAQNNTEISHFNLPDLYAEPFVLILKTNNYGYQNSYTIKDINGNIVFSKSGLANNVTYYDTLNLVAGCYTLDFYDTGDNGLYFWAQTAQGTGYFRIKAINGAYLKTFNPDFGDNIFYPFVIGDITYIKEKVKDTFFEIYPNPTSDVFTVDLDLQIKENVQIVIQDMMGKIIENTMLENFVAGSVKFDLSKFTNGIYNCTVLTKDSQRTKRIVLNK